jgi:hypothetical protein
MNKLFKPAFWVLFLLSSSASAQLQLSLQQIHDSDRWGVFVKPSDDLSPSARTVTAKGKITIVTSKDCELKNLKSHSGNWSQYLIARTPDEAPGSNYYSFRFTRDLPQVFYHDNHETLLFSFHLQGTESSVVKIMDNENDPLNKFPNSIGVSPSNELRAVDFGARPTNYLYFSGVYDPQSTDILADSKIQVNEVNPETPITNSIIAYPSTAADFIHSKSYSPSVIAKQPLSVSKSKPTDFVRTADTVLRQDNK